MLEGKKVLLGVTGSVAAYKVAFLVRLLVKEGAEVKVITTASAEKFVTANTFSNLSRNPVFNDLWEGVWTEHVHLANWADIFVIAPATANTLAKLSNGICDNLLTAVYLAATCPIVIAPAMDADMYGHFTVQDNLAHLNKNKVNIIPAGEGDHASGLQGEGRLAEPEQILDKICHYLAEKPLKGKKILITAGPTVESIDPVRFITNHSSGKMGYEIAKAARLMGAEVTLLSGPVKLTSPIPESTQYFKSAEDLFQLTTSLAPEQDVIIMAAAVADYTPESTADQKIKKKDGPLVISLKRTKDVLKHLGEHKPKDQILVGFALETQNELKNADRKLKSKHLDFIVLNSLQDAGAGFGHDTNKITILDKSGHQFRYALKSKQEVATDILNVVCNLNEKNE